MNEELVKAHEKDPNLRFAGVVLIPNTGMNIENPKASFKLAYRHIEKEASKVSFKYDQTDWWNFSYGLWVDSIANGCSLNGKPAVLIKMTYSVSEELVKKAKELLTQYTVEICRLCGIQQAILNYNPELSIVIDCFYKDDSCSFDSFDSYDVTEMHVDKTVECKIKSSILEVGGPLQKAITEIKGQQESHNTEFYQPALFVYTDDLKDKNCKLLVNNLQKESLIDMPNGRLFEKSVMQELIISKLNFADFKSV